jgi:hypothetical protein
VHKKHKRVIYIYIYIYIYIIFLFLSFDLVFKGVFLKKKFCLKKY